MPRYRLCSTSPRSASFLATAVADAAETPMSSASADGEASPSRRSTRSICLMYSCAASLDHAVRQAEAGRHADQRHRCPRQLLERCTQVLDQHEAVAAVGEPALVDQHAEVVVAPPERRADLREDGVVDPRAVRMQAAVE